MNDPAKTAPLLVEEAESGRILLVRLNRAPANAVDDDMAQAFERLAQQMEITSSVDAVILTGQGKVFCGGGDVAAFRAALGGDGSEMAALLNRLSQRVHAALDHLVQSGPLLVAAVNGPATGAGLGLVCACDVAIARPGAVLRAGFSRLGLSPDTGTTYFLPRIVGYRKALGLLLDGAAVSAESALQLGIYSEIVDADEAGFLEQVLARTRALIGSGRAARETRRLLRASFANDLTRQLRLEQEALVSLAGRPEVLEHIRRTLDPR